MPNLSVLDLVHLPRLSSKSEVKAVSRKPHLGFVRGSRRQQHPPKSRAAPNIIGTKAPVPFAVGAIMGWSIDSADPLGDLV
jgi:hypothetical protein